MPEELISNNFHFHCNGNLKICLNKKKVWTSPKSVLKSVGPRLVPFFKTVAIYFVLFIPSDTISWFAVLIKCAPILSLIFFVLLHGMSLGEEYAYSRHILLGLTFSCIGDVMLLYKHLLIPGICAFAGAQIMYILAFGFKPINFLAGTVLYTLAAIVSSCLQLKGLLSVGIYFYVFLLTTMIWRAVARDLWTWTKLCSCVGGLLFGVSDMLLGLTLFRSSVIYHQAIIMLTYYAAQCGIALSVVDSKADSHFICTCSNSFSKSSMPVEC